MKISSFSTTSTRCWIPSSVAVSHDRQICPRSTFLSINPAAAPVLPRVLPRQILTKARRWDSNAETFRTKNYETGDGNDDFEDTNQWLDILEDFIDGVWIFKTFRSFGWMLPAIISSLLFTSGPKAFLMAMAIPLGQSALSLLFQTVSGRPKNKTRRRAKSKRKPPPRASSYVDIDEEQEEYVQRERQTATWRQTRVSEDGGLNDKKTNASSSSFGGWEELDGRTINKDGKKKTSKSKMSRRDKRSETPLFMRLLIAVFPFLDMMPLEKNGASQCFQGGSILMVPNKSRSQPSLNQSLFLRRKKNSVQVLCSQKKDIPILEARSMDEIYDTMAERLVPTAASGTNTSLTRLVGLAGPPGAGKTTIASEVAKRVNKLWPQKSRAFDSQVEPPQIAVVLPMDGFHLYRHQLDSMEDPKEAHARRGAPWTFNPDLFLKCLKTLREQGSVYAPSFDHGVGDPVEDDIFINVQHKVVIVEGNYLLLEEGTWKEISAILDEKWFVDVDIDIAMERVLKRHISTGNTPELAKQRIEYNDRPNAELVCKSKKHADLIIKSVSL